jgi:hypothetical protein
MEHAVKERCDYEIGYRRAVGHYDTESDRLRKGVSQTMAEAEATLKQLVRREQEKDDNRSAIGSQKLDLNRAKLKASRT